MRWYSTVLLRQPESALSCEYPGQRVARAFLDTEEVRGSNPLAPTSVMCRSIVAGCVGAS